MRILITGASGFIGRHLVGRLMHTHELFVVERDPPRAASNEMALVIVMDLARTLDARALPEKIDVIIHLAQANGSFPEAANELLAVNTSATQQLLDYGRRAGVRQLILASTGDVYGRHIGLSKETDRPAPVSHYAITKYAAELLVQSYSDYLRPCVMRFFQPYGPGQSGRLIPKLAERIRQQGAIRLHQGDRPHMTPIYIDDVTRALQCAIDRCHSGVLNIAGNRVLSMRNLGEEIGDVLGCQPVFEETGEQAADLMGDINIMTQALGRWDMVALPDGLSRMFENERIVPWQASL